MKKIIIFALAILFISLTCNSVLAAELTRREVKINSSIKVLEEMASREDHAGAFGELLQRAEGIVIFPKLVKMGFGFGVQFGEGLVLRKDKNTQKWYGPSFIDIKTASVGVQAGIQQVSLVLVVMDDVGMAGFKKTDLDIEANFNIAPGPLGNSLQADIDFTDSIYTYSYSKGIYAGFTLEGSIIHADRKGNKAFYGRTITSKEILDTQETTNEIALKLVELIESISNK